MGVEAMETGLQYAPGMGMSFCSLPGYVLILRENLPSGWSSLAALSPLDEGLCPKTPGWGSKGSGDSSIFLSFLNTFDDRG